MFSAAMPDVEVHRPRRGRRARGSRRHQGDRDGGPGEVIGKRADRRQLRAGARGRWQTMNVPPLRFLLAPGRAGRPQDRSRWSCSQRPPRRIRGSPAFVSIAVPDRLASRSLRRRSSGRRCGDRPVADASGRGPRRARAARSRRASGSRLGRLFDRREPRLAFRQPLRRVAAAIAAAGRGVERTAQGPGQEPGDRRAVGRELVQPRVLAAGTTMSRPAGVRSSARVLRARVRQALDVGDRDDGVLVAVGQQHRPAVARDGLGGGDLRDAVAARREVHPRRQPGEGIGDDVRDGQVGEAEGLTGQPERIGRVPRWPRRPRRAGRRPRRGSPRSPPSSGRRRRRS